MVSQQLADSINIGMNLSVACAEDAPFLDEAAIAEANAGTYYQDFETERMGRFCDIWPRGDIPDDMKEPIRSDLPTLLLSGEMDPVTPPSNAERAAERLPNSVHVVAPFQGHAVATRGCIPQIVTEFIDTVDPKALDTSCVDELVPTPFFISFAGPEP